MSADARFGRVAAVIDRIVDGRFAVLLVGATERERIVPVCLLPEGAREGSWLWVSFESDRLVEARLDPVGTGAARRRVEEKMARLRRRGRDPKR